MTIVGSVIAIVLSLSSYFVGPYGGLIVLVVMFGMIFSTHMRVKAVHADLQKIKGHLGLLNAEAKENMRIEEEIDEVLRHEKTPEQMDQINSEIEKELDKYIDMDAAGKQDDKKNKY